MTVRRFDSIVVDGVAHMVDNATGNWVRHCDYVDVESEIARFKEGMPDALTLREAIEYIQEQATRTTCDHDEYCICNTNSALIVVRDFLKSIMGYAGGDIERK
jgi:hypothetical protein